MLTHTAGVAALRAAIAVIERAIAALEPPTVRNHIGPCPWCEVEPIDLSNGQAEPMIAHKLEMSDAKGAIIVLCDPTTGKADTVWAHLPTVTTQTSNPPQNFTRVLTMKANIKLDVWWCRVGTTEVEQPPPADVPANGALWVVGQGASVYGAMVAATEQLPDVLSTDDEIDTVTRLAYDRTPPNTGPRSRRKGWVCNVRLWYWFTQPTE